MALSVVTRVGVTSVSAIARSKKARAAVALRRSVIHSSVTGLCLTKLDVLDGLPSIRICTGYRVQGSVQTQPPLFVEGYGDIEPVYEEMPGWKESTIGVTDYDKLPATARSYLQRLQDVVGVPIDIISTGADREETIVLRHPFG